MEDDLFAELCGVSASAMDGAREDDRVLVQDALRTLERLVVEGDASQLASVTSTIAQVDMDAVTKARMSSVVQLADSLCQGQYVDVVRSASVQRLVEGLASARAASTTDSTVTHHATWMQNTVHALLLQESPENRVVAAYEVLLLGVAFFDMYVQANYTGPAVAPEALEDVNELIASVLSTNTMTATQLHAEALTALQVDGDSPFTICEFPQFLLMGRGLLELVGNPRYANWSVAVGAIGTEDEDDDIEPLTSTNAELVDVFTQLPSAPWWNARAAVAHERLLLSKEPSNTLWFEARRGYIHTTRKSVALLVHGLDKHHATAQYLATRAHVEWGLAQHYFDKNKQGKRSFEHAQALSGLTVQLSGSMGKRTKFQQRSVAQMVLLAASKHAPQPATESVYATAAASTTHVDFGGKQVTTSEEEPSSSVDGAETVDDEGLTAADRAIQRLVQDGDASYRDINLDQVDPDNILLEQIAFESNELTEQGNLQIIDQVVLLALCLDVKNSNANDGLTREEMFPYITRVLENPNNWMVYSTGLLERAWLECESSKRRERAVLQMQALVDQHTTRLTVLQNSLQAIQDAAPASERMAFIHALAFPPRYALKRDLSERYFKLGVVGSALEICKELEMWDDVVKCYQFLDQPTKAEKLVRERLEVAPSPYMWCALGDLTEDVSHYETAWTLSKHRYARAKRSLGRHAFEHNDLDGAIRHYQDSVEVNPMNTGAWFTLGALCMRTQQWDLALTSFTRVVQLEPDNGEAWGNIGSIHLTNSRFAQAFSVFQEALKQKRNMWQMWENYALCAMESGKYSEAMYAMHQLLDLRTKHNRPVDHEMLAWLVEALVFPKSLESAAVDDASTHVADEDATGTTVVDEDEDEDLLEFDEAAVAVDASPARGSSNHASAKKQLALLFGRITAIVTNNAKIWQVYAHFNDGLGRTQKALDCRLKQCRALQCAGWDQQESTVSELCRAAVRLAQDYMHDGSKKALYACRLYLRGVLKKAQVDFATLDVCHVLEETLATVQQLEQTAV